jgi:abhydrolase domain-containing protein 6
MKRSIKIVVLCSSVLVVAAVIIYFFFPGVVINAGIHATRWSAGLSAAQVQADDYRWNYLDGGKGDAIVFLHGFSASKDFWGPLPGSFTKTNRVIVPDLPGFGDNPRVQGINYGIPAQSKRLDYFVSALGLKKFHLVGVCYGGSIAAYFAGDHPEKVLSLTVIGPGGVTTDVTSPFKREFLKDRTKTVCMKTVADYNRVMSLGFDHPARVPEHFKKYIASEMARDFDFHTKIFNEIAATGEEGILDNRLAKITSPTLVIWGKNDRVFPVEGAAKFKRDIKDCRVLIVDSGHVVNVDEPEKTEKTCTEFMAYASRLK